MVIPQFISWWTLGCFHLLGIVNIGTIMNIHVQVIFCGQMLSFLLGIYLGVQLLDHMVTLCLTFWGTARLLQRAELFYISINSVWGIQFCYILTNTCYYLLFYYSCSSRCKMLSHVVLICMSLVTNDVERLFMCFLAIFISSLEKCLFKLFAHFKIYIQIIRPLSGICLQVFSPILWV